MDLFATILRLEANGYYLVTPVEKMKIIVEEVPFIAVDLDVRGSGEDKQLLFSTNVGDYIIAGKDHPIHMRAERPFILVRDGLAAYSTLGLHRLADEGEAQATTQWSSYAEVNLFRCLIAAVDECGAQKPGDQRAFLCGGCNATYLRIGRPHLPARPN